VKVGGGQLNIYQLKKRKLWLYNFHFLNF
jgi:hypothetical protein